MKRLQVFCVNTHQNGQYGSQSNLVNYFDPYCHGFSKAHAQFLNTYRTMTHTLVPLRGSIGTLTYIWK